MNKSVWEATANTTHSYSSLTTDQTADVVVIGAGISGLITALHLADAGKSVIVLEAMHVGMGTTGNSTGNLYATVDQHLTEVKKKWGLDITRQVVESRTQAILEIEHIIRRFEIDCDFERVSFTHFLEKSSKTQEEFIEKEYEVMQECGLNPIIDSSCALPFKVIKVLSIPNQAQFHPLKFIRGLAQNMPRNCQIFENSAVTDYDEDSGIVKTATNKVTAKQIVMATHVPKGIFAVQTVLGPYREFGVAAPVTSTAIPPGIFWGLDQPKHSLRVCKNGPDSYVLAIGDKFKTGHPENTFEYVNDLQVYLKERFAVTDYKFTWGGQQYKPADILPYIGQHSDKMYYMTGFSTDGLVYGALSARIVSDMILGRQNKWQDIFNSSRHTPLKSAKEFIKENADNMVQYIKDIPWKVDAKKVAEIKPGEGKIIQEGGEKIAVYKDINGKIEAVSAVCTHMKCIVNWNTAENTWDCPCHGSRFKTNGEVIEGPAITALKKKQTDK
jgi:glycine/D-amino acid oxidase-like deaminating enzyme/nitrite reductase/ring-hydroxylating ferredoxin subunit